MVSLSPIARAAGIAAVLGLSATLGAASPRAGVPREQILRGIILDHETRAPITDVVVTLMSERERELEHSVRTDSTGRFVIPTGRYGRFVLRATRIGYRPVTTPSFAVREGDVVAFELEMSVTQQILAPLTIVAKERPKNVQLISYTGFEYRMRRSAGGYFFSQDDIERRGALSIGDLIRGVAGVSVGGTGIDESISFRRVMIGVLSGRQCSPMYYIDGAPFPADRVVSTEGDTTYAIPLIISSLMMNDVLGVEVYSSPSVTPGEFIQASACGVIAVWTRKGL